MKKSFLQLFIIFIFSIVFVCNSFAWDDTGHKLIAYIAWEQMTPTAREKAFEILMSAPEDSDLSAFYMQDSRSAATRQREFFMIASVWADIVRDKKFDARYTKYHHGNWHYLDTFWRETDGKIEIVPELKSDKENAVERLLFFNKILRDNAALNSEKAIALAWILHLAGDIHQPLHDSARVTEFSPKGDQGGNLFVVSPKDAPGIDRISLHWYWDSIIGRVIPRKNDECDSSYIPKIAKIIEKNYSFSKMVNRLETDNYDEWQREGFQIASTKLYPKNLIINQMPSDNYKKQAFRIAEERIALAGYRLGEMLNQIFDNHLHSNDKILQNMK